MRLLTLCCKILFFQVGGQLFHQFANSLKLGYVVC